MVETIYKVKKASRLLLQDLGRRPTEEEVSEKANNALDAYLSGEFKLVSRKQSESKGLYKVRPIRVQTYTPKESAVASGLDGRRQD